ncbi:MAG: TRAP transporter substrate-binding protein [Syntrophaceae bacterium]|nr:TRAP transporter substrate-binding protein [Syntrophaceae bacterium]
MKKRGLLMLLGSICLVFILAAPSLAQVIKLTLADQNPQTGWGPVHALQPWVKKVEDATKGKVKIEVYYSQTLAKGPDIWNAVKSGIADMGWCFHGYWPGMTPLSDVISLPALPFTTGEKGSEILWKLYEKFPEIQKEFQDVKPLMLWTSHPYLLITTKKQVKTLEDIKGLKIRQTGGPPTDQMKALGGVPMLIPMPDNYISMQKGVIDGMGAPWEAIHAFRLYEVVKFYTQVPFPAVYFSMSMNKNKWNSLPKDVQDAIMSVSGLEGSKFWGHNFFDTAKNGVYEKAKETGREIVYYELPPEERAKWLEVGGKPIWRDWVKKMEEKGLTSAQKILDATLELAK